MSRSARDTPMMRQYLGIKARHPDAIIFYRMGDFYELFFEDAERVAPLLDITLTTRDRGKPDAVPMCGVPVHSADGYVKRLADLGLPGRDLRAGGRSKEHRGPTPGTARCGRSGDPGAGRRSRGTGRGSGADRRRDSRPELRREKRGSPLWRPRPGAFGPPRWAAQAERRCRPRCSRSWSGSVPARCWFRPRLPKGCARGSPSACRRLPHPGRSRLFEPRDEGLAGMGASGRAASALLAFLEAHQPFALRHTPQLRRYRLGDAMVLDAATRTHLELFESLEDRSRKGTLIERIDETITPLGARRLLRWVAYPLLDCEEIREPTGSRRLSRRAGSLQSQAAKGPGGRPRSRAHPRQGLAPRGTAPRSGGAAELACRLCPVSWRPSEKGRGICFPSQAARLPALVLPEPLPEVEQLLYEAIVDDPPVVPRGSRGAGETGYIRAGFRPELDALRESASKGREWIAGLEVRERERTGVPNLKVRFHPVHGYSLEVTKTQLGRIPDDYERKQTLANAERFTTPELREMESKVLGANERAAALEREVFEGVRQSVLEQAPGIRAAAEAVASLDALQCLAEVARRDGWVRPLVEESDLLEIRAGRHPVVEPLLAARTGEEFVPNDTDLDPASTRILLITGPNMAGKSTYLRQVALLVLLAQIGSFVPAESARIGIVDRIFTRVGATDRLTRGESTFMVEMRETAEILSQASSSSLIILDEIGRGTSTFDGLSIAWAVAEYLHDTPGLGPRTLFATHYHELADLARTRSGVRNAHFEAREWGEEVLFLRQLVPGEASRSYGIQVARLAGLPDTVLERAREILHNLESEELGEDGRPRLAEHGKAERRERSDPTTSNWRSSGPAHRGTRARPRSSTSSARSIRIGSRPWKRWRCWRDSSADCAGEGRLSDGARRQIPPAVPGSAACSSASIGRPACPT